MPFPGVGPGSQKLEGCGVSLSFLGIIDIKTLLNVEGRDPNVKALLYIS